MQEKCTFESDGLKLSGVLHIPDSYKNGSKLPAFIVCHGFVGSKDESHAQLLCVPKTSSPLIREGNRLTWVDHDRAGLLHLVGLDRPAQGEEPA